MVSVNSRHLGSRCPVALHLIRETDGYAAGVVILADKGFDK